MVNQAYRWRCPLPREFSSTERAPKVFTPHQRFELSARFVRSCCVHLFSLVDRQNRPIRLLSRGHPRIPLSPMMISWSASRLSVCFCPSPSCCLIHPFISVIFPPAKSRIPALRDPQAVLGRKLPFRPLKSVIKKLHQRLGLSEESILTKRPGCTSNGGEGVNGIEPPVEKRPRLEPSLTETANGHIAS